jgi:hypothetical protein
MKKPTYKELERKLMELESQMAHVARSAYRDVINADSRLMASAAIVSITALGGRQIVGPVAIRDGLSDATIEALRSDIVRTITVAGFTL